MATRRSKSGFATCVSVLSVVGFNDASAQTERSAANMILEEIEVTARRRDEGYLDVPMSLSAVTGAKLIEQGINNVQDLGNTIPNVTFAPGARRGNNYFTVRGIGGTNPRAGGALDASGAAMYVDGHYLPNFIGFGMTAMDIDRVEVARGPQGTLFGRNATGGAVNIITSKPSDEFLTDVTLRAERYGTFAGQAMVNIPFTDTLYGRFGAAKEVSDGYAYNRYLDRDWGETDSEAFHGALRFVPNEHWTFDLSYRHDEQDDENTHGQCRLFRNQEIVNQYPNYTGPSGNVAEDPVNGIGIWGWVEPGDPRFVDSIDGVMGGTAPPFPGAQGDGTATYALWAACEADTAAGLDVFSSEKEPYLELENQFATFTAAWDSAGEIAGMKNMSAKLLAGYSHYAMNFLSDSDYTPLPIIALGITGGRGFDGNEREATSVELQFNVEVNDKVDFVVGVSQFEDKFNSGDGNCLSEFRANRGDAALARWDHDNNPATPPLTFDEVKASGVSTDHTQLVMINGGRDGISVPVQPPFAFGANGQAINFAFGGPGVPFSTACDSQGGAGFEFLTGGVGGPGPEPNTRNFETDNEAIAVFSHMTWDLTERLELALGLRYTEEERAFAGVEVAAGGRDACGFNTDAAGLPPDTAMCAPISGTYELSYLNVYDAGNFNDLQTKYSETTGMASLSFALTDRTMIYGLYSTGFLSGSFNDEFNADLFPATRSFLTYRPETVENYEVGFKGTLLDGLVSVSTSLFLMEYEDKQVTAALLNSFPNLYCPAFNDICEYTSNAATMDVRGLELELRAALWDGGQLALDYGYLDVEYGTYETLGLDPSSGQVTVVDKSGALIPSYAPENTLNLALSHEVPLSSGASVTGEAGMYFQTDYNFAAGTAGAEHPGNYVCIQDDYSTYRARVTYRSADARYAVALFGKNLSDERVLTSCDQFRQGTYAVTYSEPRTYGIELKVRFQ